VPSSVTSGPGKNTTVTYTDASVAKKTAYLYRIVATNVVGDTTAYAAPAVGYPRVNADADATPPVSVTSR